MLGWKVRGGFTLIEVVVYCSLLLIFVIIAMRLSRDVREFALFSSRENSRLIRKQLLFDVIFRDVVSASGNRFDWGAEDFVFKKATLGEDGRVFLRAVGFYIKNKNVVRYEGEYDFEKSAWIDKSVSLVGSGVEEFWHELEYCDRSKKKIVGVMVTVDSFQHYIRIRNC